MCFHKDISHQTVNLTWESSFSVPLFARYPLKARDKSGAPYDFATRQSERKKENLSSCLEGGRSNCLDRNTKRGKTLARFLCQVSSIMKFSNVSFDDCFAALLKSSCHSALATAVSSKPSYQCGDRGGRCPPMTVSLSYGFFLSFTVSRFEIVTLRFPVRGSSGRIELDPSCRTDHSTI